MRILKIRDVGDHYCEQVIPQIRLQGKWLQKAGLVPGKHVQVSNPKSGTLLIEVKKNV